LTISQEQDWLTLVKHVGGGVGVRGGEGGAGDAMRDASVWSFVVNLIVVLNFLHPSAKAGF
jgi:type 1 glutamine amidotransferase